MSRVFIERFDAPDGVLQSVMHALDWVDAARIIAPDARVFIKPNLTWKRPSPGVTVTPAFLRAVVQGLLPFTHNITIGEAEGGQACFQPEEAFDSHGLYDLQGEYGIQVINLSKCRQELATTRVAGERVSIELPSLLLHDVDVFITVPVPKIHAMTGVSIGFKNQWGCLGNKMRVTQHPRFNRTILAINKLVLPRLCICDGTYFLDRAGPMTGEAVPMNLVVAGTDVGAASLVCCEIMGVNPMSLGHYQLARHEGMLPNSLESIALNCRPHDYAHRTFRLKRSAINYVQLAAFRNPMLNRFFYDSAFADAAHEILWVIRRNSHVKRLLYGKYGAGEANRGGRLA